MERNYCFDIFIGPQKKFSVFQDTNFLTEILAQRAKAANNFRQELEKIVNSIDAYVVEKKETVDHCPDTLYYLAALELAKSDIDKQAKAELKDFRRFEKLANSLSEHGDEAHSKKNLQIEEMAFESLRSSYNRDLKDVSETKEKYHKAMMDKEIVEMKQMLARNDSHRANLEVREQLLKDKVQKAKEEYNIAIGIANETCQHLDSASAAYLQAWRPLAEKRIQKQIETLTCSAQSGPSMKLYLEQVDYRRLVTTLEMTETIKPPRFQEYTRTKEKADLMIGTCQPLNQRALAIEDYQNDEPNQLNFKSGDKLKVLIQANSRGLAFGEKRGKYGKKKRGFFPACHVQLVG